jgi:hypothetical protein
MCVVKECGVSGHMTNNLSDQFSRGPSTEELCFIHATERSVYEDLVLSTVKFGQGREDILQVKKTHSEWQSLFSILSRADVPEAEGLADVQRRLALGEEDIGMTPRILPTSSTSRSTRCRNSKRWNKPFLRFSRLGQQCG